jgi:hypothetical protein
MLSNIEEISHHGKPIKISSLGNVDNLVEQIKSIITNPVYIRLGVNEMIRSKELAEYLSVLTGTHITHTRKLPNIMTDIITKSPELNIIKKIKTNGTVYIGLTIANNPVAKSRNPPLNTQQKNERRRARNTEILNTIKIKICEQCGWTEQQYQQMCNLGLIQVIRDGNVINISCMITVAVGNLIKYIYDKILILKREERRALIIKEDFNKAQRNDSILSINTDAVIYTNRLLSAQITYDTGDKLSRAINSYINTINNLPIIDDIVYPNIQGLIDLSTHLKSNSMFKTRKDMAEKQESSNNQECEFHVNEDDLYTYSEQGIIITKVN